MAGPAPVVEKPKLGRSATVAGLIFALLVLSGFGAGTAVSYRDTVAEKNEKELEGGTEEELDSGLDEGLGGSLSEEDSPDE